MPYELTIFKKPCSVTMFDLKVELSKDGRERGLWIFLEDLSKGRTATYEKWLEGAVNTFMEMMVLKGHDKGNIEKFGAWMSLDGALKGLASGEVHQGALLEWPAIKTFYKRMGEAIHEHEKKEKACQTKSMKPPTPRASSSSGSKQRKPAKTKPLMKAKTSSSRKRALRSSSR